MKNSKILGGIFIFATSIFFLNSCSNKTEKNDDITKSDDVYVSFETDGGTLIKNFEVDDYYRIEKPLNPTKEGSIFVGWYEDKSYEKKFDFNDQILKDKILYARWLDINDLSNFTYYLNSNNAINTNNVDNIIKINGLNNNDIYDLYIPEGVSNIEANSFSNNKKITSVSLPSTLKKIDSQAFIECENLRSVYYSGTINDWLNLEFTSYSSNPMYYASEFYKSNNKGNVEYHKHKYSLLNEIIIPTDITSIKRYQFCGFNSLKDITIPNNIETIGQGAFLGCSSLERMTLPFVGDKRYNSEYTNVRYPFGYIFGTVEYSGGINTKQTYQTSNYSNTQSTTYYIPSTLKEVTITDSTYLQQGAFNNCSYLTNIKLNNGITVIGSNSLSNCNSLKNIVIPDSVLSIGEYALSGCSSLKDITIPNTVEYIGNAALSSCSSLETITIPFVGNKRYESSSDRPQYPLGYIFGTSNYTGSTAIEQKYYANNGVYNATYYFPTNLKKVVITDLGIIPTFAFLNCGTIELVY